jgi:hypothetical protein
LCKCFDYAYLAWTILAHGDYRKLADTTFVEAKVDNMQFCKANIKVRSQLSRALKQMMCCLTGSSVACL